MLLLGLVLGALLGAAGTFLVLRERMRSALTQNRAGEDSADRLLRLADERAQLHGRSPSLPPLPRSVTRGSRPET